MTPVTGSPLNGRIGWAALALLIGALAWAPGLISADQVLPVELVRQGCVVQPDGKPQRGGERFGDELRVTSQDRRLLLVHGLSHRCCHSVDVEVSTSGERVRFLEVWDGEGCRCWCSSRIEARTDPLPPGEYAVEVVTFRRGGPHEKRLEILEEIVTVE